MLTAAIITPSVNEMSVQQPDACMLPLACRAMDAALQPSSSAHASAVEEAKARDLQRLAELLAQGQGQQGQLGGWQQLSKREQAEVTRWVAGGGWRSPGDAQLGCVVWCAAGTEAAAAGGMAAAQQPYMSQAACCSAALPLTASV